MQLQSYNAKRSQEFVAKTVPGQTPESVAKLMTEQIPPYELYHQTMSGIKDKIKSHKYHAMKIQDPEFQAVERDARILQFLLLESNPQVYLASIYLWAKATDEQLGWQDKADSLVGRFYTGLLKGANHDPGVRTEGLVSLQRVFEPLNRDQFKYVPTLSELAQQSATENFNQKIARIKPSKAA